MTASKPIFLVRYLFSILLSWSACHARAALNSGMWYTVPALNLLMPPVKQNVGKYTKCCKCMVSRKGVPQGVIDNWGWLKGSF